MLNLRERPLFVCAAPKWMTASLQKVVALSFFMLKAIVQLQF